MSRKGNSGLSNNSISTGSYNEFSSNGRTSYQSMSNNKAIRSIENLKDFKSNIDPLLSSLTAGQKLILTTEEMGDRTTWEFVSRGDGQFIVTRQEQEGGGPRNYDEGRWTKSRVAKQVQYSGLVRASVYDFGSSSTEVYWNK